MFRAAVVWKMECGGDIPLRRLFLPYVLLGSLVSGCHTSTAPSTTHQETRKTPVLIKKDPVVFASHTFDPAAPPPEMPPLPAGETAECDSNFLCRASVGGQAHRTDATHATLTITQVMMGLQLQINIWLPNGYTQTVAEHEDGHRQIAEYYYQTADKLAERIATSYIGKRVEVTGTEVD